MYGVQSPARRFYVGGAFVEDTDVAFRLAVQGNRKVDLEMASIVGQLVVVQTDTGDGLVAAQVIVNPRCAPQEEFALSQYLGGQCQ